jgi:hypothetical protein
MSTTQENLLRIVELTREMLAMAEADTWDDLPGLESRRGSLMEQYFAVTRDTGLDAGDAASLYELHELNSRILDLGKTRRQQLMQALSESNRQRHAVANYRQNLTG